MTLERKMIRRATVAGHVCTSLRNVACLSLLILAVNSFASATAAATELPYPARTFTYKTVERLELKADVYRLPDHVVRPAILWVHGGAVMMGSRRDIAEMLASAKELKKYVEAGYVVVSIDYRLAPETKLDAIVGDLRDAYSWLRTKGPELFQIDPDRIGVVGPSGGGYLTLMYGFIVRPRPKVLVSFYGYGDVGAAWYSKPDPHYNLDPPIAKEAAYGVLKHEPVLEGYPDKFRFYAYCRQQGLWTKEVTGLDPAKDPEAVARFCPVRNVTRDYPPTMLVHGELDTDVPFGQSVEMADELARKGVEHQLIIVPKGPHGFDLLGIGIDSPETGRLFDRVLGFLGAHLK